MLDAAWDPTLNGISRINLLVLVTQDPLLSRSTNGPVVLFGSTYRAVSGTSTGLIYPPLIVQVSENICAFLEVTGSYFDYEFVREGYL